MHAAPALGTFSVCWGEVKQAGRGGRTLSTPRGQRRPCAVRPVYRRVQQRPLHTGAHAPHGKEVHPCTLTPGA